MSLLNLKPIRAKRPSTLLSIALRDLKRVHARGDIKIDMDVYYGDNDPWINDGKCSVCLAGSCLVGRKGIKGYSGSLSPIHELPPELRLQMWAINSLRGGDIGSALDYLGVNHPTGLPHAVEMVGWEDTPAGRRRFYAYINRLIKLLKKHGV